MDTPTLLKELAPTVEDNLNRHLGVAQEWMPHEYVPWSEGRDFAMLDGEPWAVEQSTLSPIARTALEVNLLTEDNLPSYHREVERAFGRDSAWGAWVNRWTAEEGRHAFCIRDYLLVTRGVDPDELERARMQTMETGFDSGEKPLLNVCAYVSFQELATRVSHRNTGRITEDPIAEQLLTRVAKDENLHMIFYRNIVEAALELAPGPTMRAIADEVVGFQMPGAVIPGFARKAVQMARAGIYDLRIHHDDIVMPLVRQWKLFELEGLDDEGEQARQELAAAIAELDEQATRFVAQRDGGGREAGGAQGRDKRLVPGASGGSGGLRLVADGLAEAGTAGARGGLRRRPDDRHGRIGRLVGRADHDALGHPVEQRQRTGDHAAGAVDVLDARDDRLGVAHDPADQVAALLEVVGDRAELAADDPEVERETGDQEHDVDDGQHDEGGHQDRTFPSTRPRNRWCSSPSASTASTPSAASAISAVSSVLAAAASSESRTRSTRWSMVRTRRTRMVSRPATARTTTKPPMTAPHHRFSWVEVSPTQT